MTNKVIKTLLKNSTYKPDGLEAIKKAVNNNEPITFYSWECPPRQIVENGKLGRWVTFDVDIDSIVDGKMLDEFTEVPWITLETEKEKWFINKILPLYKKANYIKIIADTNAKYLFVKSYKILGGKKIRHLSYKFKISLEKKAKKLFGNKSPDFVLYTKLQKAFEKEYETYFNFVFNSFSGIKSDLVGKSINKAWYDCMFNHIGYSKGDKIELEEVMKRAIASYAAEGVLFEILDRAGTFPNPVWVNWEEKPSLARASNILRQRLGLNKLPIVYFIGKGK